MPPLYVLINVGLEVDNIDRTDLRPDEPLDPQFGPRDLEDRVIAIITEARESGKTLSDLIIGVSRRLDERCSKANAETSPGSRGGGSCGSSRPSR